MGAAPADRGPVPRLHLVTDDDVLGLRRFGETAAALLAACGPALALHIRGPRTGGGALYAIASSLAGPARDAGARLVVNDRVDVALAVGVSAVHLGRRSLPLAETRRLLGSGASVGISAHATEEAAEAAAEGADWIFVGTIYDTPSHPDRRGCGPAGVRTAVSAAAGTPVLAIGGVTPERVAELRAVGAHGVAVVRGVWHAAEPMAAAKRYLEALETHGADAEGSREDA